MQSLSERERNAQENNPWPASRSAICPRSPRNGSGAAPLNGDAALRPSFGRSWIARPRRLSSRPGFPMTSSRSSNRARSSPGCTRKEHPMQDQDPPRALPKFKAYDKVQRHGLRLAAFDANHVVAAAKAGQVQTGSPRRFASASPTARSSPEPSSLPAGPEGRFPAGRSQATADAFTGTSPLTERRRPKRTPIPPPAKKG